MRNLQICSLPELQIFPSYRKAFKCNNCTIISKQTTDKSSQTHKENSKYSLKPFLSYIKNNYQTFLLISAITLYFLTIIAPTLQILISRPIESSEIFYEESLNLTTEKEFGNFQESIQNSNSNIIEVIKKIQEENYCSQFKKISNVNDKVKYAAENFGFVLKLEKFSGFFEVGNCEYFIGISKKGLTKIISNEEQIFIDTDNIFEYLVTPDYRYFVYTTPRGSLFAVNLLTLGSKRLHRSYFWFSTEVFFSVSSDSKILYFTRGLLTDIYVFSLETLNKIGEFDRDIDAILKFKAVSTDWLAVKTQKYLRIFKLPGKSPLFELAKPGELSLIIDHRQEFKDLLLT